MIQENLRFTKKLSYPWYGISGGCFFHKYLEEIFIWFPCQSFTHHKSLNYVFKEKDLNIKQTRWI